MEEQHSEKNSDVSRDASNLKEGCIEKQSECTTVEESKCTEASKDILKQYETGSRSVPDSFAEDGIIIGDSAASDFQCNVESKDKESANFISEKSDDQSSVVVGKTTVPSVSDSIECTEPTKLLEHSSLEKDDSQSKDSSTNHIDRKDDLTLPEESRSGYDNVEKELPSGDLELEDISNTDSEYFDDNDKEAKTVLTDDKIAHSEDTSEPQSMDIDIPITDTRHGENEVDASLKSVDDVVKVSEIEWGNVVNPIEGSDSKTTHANVNKDEVSSMETENIADTVNTERSEDELMDVDETPVPGGTCPEGVIKESGTDHAADGETSPEKLSVQHLTDNESKTEGMVIGDDEDETVVNVSDMGEIAQTKTNEITLSEVGEIVENDGGEIAQNDVSDIAQIDDSKVAPGDAGEIALSDEDGIAKSDADGITKSDAGKIAKSDAGKIAQSDAGEIAQSDAGEIAQSDAGEIAQSDAGEIAQSDAGEIAQSDVGEIAQSDAGEIAQSDAGEIALNDAGEIAQSDAGKITQSDAGEIAQSDTGDIAQGDGYSITQNETEEIALIDAPPSGNDKNKIPLTEVREDSFGPSESETANSPGIQKESERMDDVSGQEQDEPVLSPDNVSSDNARSSETLPARESHASEEGLGNIEIVDCKTIDNAPEEITIDEESCHSIEASKHASEDPLGTSESTKDTLKTVGGGKPREEKRYSKNLSDDDDDSITADDPAEIGGDDETTEIDGDGKIIQEKGDSKYLSEDDDSITVDEPAELCSVVLEEDNDTETTNEKRANIEEQSENSEFIQVNKDDEDVAICDSSQEKDPFATTDEAKDKDDEAVKSHSEEQPMDVDGSHDSGDVSVDSETSKDKTVDKEKLGGGEAVTEAQEKSDASGETITGDKQPTEPVLQPEEGEEEEICIIPDTMPRLPNNVDGSEKSGGKITTKGFASLPPSSGMEPSRNDKTDCAVASSSRESTNKKSTEPRRTPGRPQRQAAKRAVSQMKELAESDGSDPEIGKSLAESDGSDPEVGGSMVIGKVVEQTTMCEQRRVCGYCGRLRACKFQYYEGTDVKYFCCQDCVNAHIRFNKKAMPVVSTAKKAKKDSDEVFARKCAQCCGCITGEEKNLSWETMDYCDEECLAKYQKVLGAQCANCKGTVAQTSLGKYCVRFGYDVKQFCCSTCLEEFKKGLKVCSYCQKDISGGAEGFLAPVGDKGQFKDFCTQACMEKYDQMSNHQPPPVVVHQCAVCNNEKVVTVEVIHNKAVNKLCSEPCYAAFKFVNGIVADKCLMCKKYFDKKEVDTFAVYSDDEVHHFCSKMCMNVYILGNRKIVPCQWCKVKKYNFDMIKRTLSNGQVLLLCSLNCMTLYQVSMSAITSKRVKCDMCNTVSQAQYHLTMSDATVRNFCTYQCVMQFQGQYSKTGHPLPDSTPVPTGVPRRYMQKRVVQPQQNENSTEAATNGVPVICSVQSLATSSQTPPSSTSAIVTRTGTLKINNSVATMASKASQIVYKQQVILRPTPPKTVRNKSVFCRPYVRTKGVSCRPSTSTKETQTEEEAKPALIPIPIPIYVPCPMAMYSLPYPQPFPFPLPIPVPMFIPTTRNSARGIMKEIKRIQEKTPADPFEAEILMMAEIVAGEKKAAETSDSESDGGDNDAQINEEASGGSPAPAEERFTPEAVDTSNTEEMLQMALKMASELEEPADLEAALTPSTITPQSQPPAVEPSDTTESEDDPEPVAPAPEAPATRSKKRTVRSRPSSSGPATKRRRASSTTEAPLLPPPEPPQPRQPEAEKPDANMCLKYTFGVNAWKQWVIAKNAELEKAAASNRKLKLFKPEILQLTADELNYSLCLFVKEVRRPNGNEYAPDTIYYLCLGIQQYLYENGRIDNIFTDPYYEKFTECLDEVARKFSALYNDAQFIVTRVEEEHLWESKQLGAHSPHVLLSTLLFFNTKHFNLTTVDEHMQLSFSHIMKHWKRNPSQPGASKTPGSRNVLLRFYPPQSALDANSKKKRVYEQQENEENPIRCPVKLYEFYLSKCPESVKTRNDVFYLLPERSCVPDSPVWYSTMALGKEPLVKMLNRVRMVKEINMAILSS